MEKSTEGSNRRREGANRGEEEAERPRRRQEQVCALFPGPASSICAQERWVGTRGSCRPAISRQRATPVGLFRAQMSRAWPCGEFFTRATPAATLAPNPARFARASSASGRSGRPHRQIAPSRRLFPQGGRHTSVGRGEADAQLEITTGRLGDATT